MRMPPHRERKPERTDLRVREQYLAFPLRRADRTDKELQLLVRGERKRDRRLVSRERTISSTLTPNSGRNRIPIEREWPGVPLSKKDQL